MAKVNNTLVQGNKAAGFGKIKGITHKGMESLTGWPEE